MYEKSFVNFNVIVHSTFCKMLLNAANILCNVYSDECNQKVKVVSKKEFIDKYEQEINGEQIAAIAYGTGYIKYPKCKKQDIIYICLLREDCSIIWGEVSPTENKKNSSLRRVL